MKAKKRLLRSGDYVIVKQPDSPYSGEEAVVDKVYNGTADVTTAEGDLISFPIRCLVPSPYKDIRRSFYRGLRIFGGWSAVWLISAFLSELLAILTSSKIDPAIFAITWMGVSIFERWEDR